MRDTCTNHFEPQRFDRVGRGGVVRSKYGPKLPPFAPYCIVFWPSLTPAADPVKSLWFKMVCTCVPHIALHVFSPTSTSWGHFRPQKSILAKFAIFGCFKGLFLGNVPPQLAPYIDSYVQITFLQWLKVIVLVTLKELGVCFQQKCLEVSEGKCPQKWGQNLQTSP